jgi:DNA-binding IclR family transcriptional regulator
MEELKELYPNGLQAMTAHTITDFSELQQQLRTIYARGYAYEKGEITDQIECFAVPLCKGSVIFASISVSIPSFRVTDDKKELICSTLTQARLHIENYINTNDLEIGSLQISQIG